MAFNGSGLFNIDSTGQPVSANTLIESSVFNALTDDLATGLSNCITKDGQQTVTANLPMATYRHTGVGNAVARTDYAAAGQVQDGKLNWVDGGGTADAITATYSPSITALVNGQLCCVRATAANATTTPTFAPDGLTARTIVKVGGTALAVGDIAADGHELILRYDLANTRWELLNPAPASLAANTFTGVQRWAKGADVASASALTLGTDGNYFDITGTTTITSIGSLGVGTWVKLHFDGALTLTHHATDLVLAGAANITTAAGDEIEFAEYASGDWRMVGGVKADGTAWVGGGENVAVAGTFALSGDISPAQITADQNDYSPTGLSGASVIRITTDSTLRTITGLAGGADGRVVCIDYISGSGGLKLADDSASSTAANRFDLAADVTLTAPCIAVLKYDATSSRWRVMAAQSSGSATITLGTPQATTSGTSIDFTSIPSGTKMIIVNLNGVSTSGTSIALVQLGDSGGVENTGYSGSTANTLYTDGARLYTTWAASTIAHGTITIVLINSSTKTWAITGVLGYSNAGLSNNLGYTKSLSADLDRIRLTTVGGTDTFDAGEINILYFG